MTTRMQSQDGDFEVVPQSNAAGGFMSIETASADDGDPYENRADIKETKGLLPALVQRLNFKDGSDIDQMHEKLKARDALDAGIESEISNLEQISQNEEFASIKLREAASVAKDFLANAKQRAGDSNTTVKRALDILEVTLPVFLEACNISNEKQELSQDCAQLQELYRKTIREMMLHQQNFEMEERGNKLTESKALLERSISASGSDRDRIEETLANIEETKQLDQFVLAQSDVDLIINTETQELDAWSASCNVDLSILAKAIEEQKDRHSSATTKYESRIRTIETKLEVNVKRQAELLKQLKRLKEEETHLKDNKVFEEQVQDRAVELDASVSDELTTRKKKVKDVKDHASTAQEIMFSMHQCSSVLFGSAIETQKAKEEKLMQLRVEALTRERNALATAAVEFKVQIQMTDENVTEYTGQLQALKREIEKAARKGQNLIVSKKKADAEDFELEMKTERERTAEAQEKLTVILEKLKGVDENLNSYGVRIPAVEEMFAHRMADMNLDNGGQFSMPSFQ